MRAQSFGEKYRTVLVLTTVVFVGTHEETTRETHKFCFNEKKNSMTKRGHTVGSTINARAAAGKRSKTINKNTVVSNEDSYEETCPSMEESGQDIVALESNEDIELGKSIAFTNPPMNTQNDPIGYEWKLSDKTVDSTCGEKQEKTKLGQAKRRYQDYLRKKVVDTVKFVANDEWAKGLIIGAYMDEDDDGFRAIVKQLEGQNVNIEQFADKNCKWTRPVMSQLRHNMERGMKRAYQGT